MDSTYSAYKWLDAQDMKPEDKNSPENLMNKALLSKVFDFLDLA